VPPKTFNNFPTNSVESLIRYKMFVTKFLIFGLIVNNFLVVLCGRRVMPFKSVECVVSDKFVHSNFTCNANSTLTVGLFFKRPLNVFHVSFKFLFILCETSIFDFQAQGNVFFKMGSTFRLLVELPKVELCKFLRTSAKEDIIFDTIIKSLKEAGGSQVIHPCPYKVETN
jgi:hypothetical protein